MAAGVGVTGGRIGFDGFFLFGVDGAISSTFGRASDGAFFRFLLATAFGGVDALLMLSLTEIALKRADFLEDMWIYLRLECLLELAVEGLDSLGMNRERMVVIFDNFKA